MNRHNVSILYMVAIVLFTILKGQNGNFFTFDQMVINLKNTAKKSYLLIFYILVVNNKKKKIHNEYCV